MSVLLTNRHQKYITIFGIGPLKRPDFWCRSLKRIDTKNHDLFLVSVVIIDRHYKEIIGITINYFSSSACFCNASPFTLCIISSALGLSLN
jgi:hypothetical protein